MALRLQHVAHGQHPDQAAVLQSTVWRWNRAVYDPAEGGHLRIELRALPSGPTVVDMLANAAFLLGLTLALAPGAAAMARRFAFQQAHHNLYRAAQFGLGRAGLAAGSDGRAWTLPAAELVRRLLPTAAQGLPEDAVSSWRRRRGGRRGS